MKKLLITLAILVGIGSGGSYFYFESYQPSFGFAARTITNPATNSALSSAVIRNEFQLLENEFANLWTVTTNYGSAVANATGTPIWFQAGLQASSTSHFAATDYSGTATYTGVITSTSNAANTLPYASTTAISASGRAYSADTANSWSGPLTPTRRFVLMTGTTTSWTATTSGAYVPSVIAPFAGTLRTTRCLASTTQSFLGVVVRVNNTKVTPNYFIASTTIGTITFSANNTFVAGDRISMYVGTTTDANALFISCSFDTTEI